MAAFARCSFEAKIISISLILTNQRLQKHHKVIWLQVALRDAADPLCDWSVTNDFRVAGGHRRAVGRNFTVLKLEHSDESSVHL